MVLPLGRKEKMKTLKYIILITCALLCFTGCGARKISANYVGAEKCTAVVSGTITVSCGDKEYTVSDTITVLLGTEEYVVLDQTADDNDLGAWIGRVDALEGNVFVSSINAGPDGEVFVMVNGVYYHAKPVDAIKDTDVVLNASSLKASSEADDSK